MSHAKRIINDHAVSDIREFLAKHFDFQQIAALQEQYDYIMIDYHMNPTLKILSTIRMEKLESFKQWIPKALANHKLVMPDLVSKMLMGDIYALSMFDVLYKADHKEELLITYSKIHTDIQLKENFAKYGGAEDARAIMTAEHWLASKEAADIFASTLPTATNPDVNRNLSGGSYEEGLDVLCAVNAMLHISNAYIHCSM